MPKAYNVADFEEAAPSKINNPKPLTWFNRYGGFIVETRWNSRKNQFDTIYHPYDYPNINTMPSE